MAAPGKEALPAPVRALLRYAKQKYGVTPDHPWRNDPESRVLRHKDSGKWFGIIMHIPRARLGLPADAAQRSGPAGQVPFDLLQPVPAGDSEEDAGAMAAAGIRAAEDVFVPAGDVWCFNVRCDPVMGQFLRDGAGILPAYHMNRRHWLSVLLDGTVPDKKVKALLDTSFMLTASKETMNAMRGPKAWAVPSNPSMFDVQAAFAADPILNWKQAGPVRVGDTVYLYLGAPISAILYRCRVVATDLPRTPWRPGDTIRKAMTLEMQEKYDPARYPLSWLRERGVYSVRSLRSLPDEVVSVLEREAAGKRRAARAVRRPEG